MKMRKLFAAVAACLLLLTAVGCGAPKFTREEILRELPPLVEGSRVLNRIYFGAGYPVDTEQDIDPALGAYYYVDAEEIGLYSITEIQEATEKIFTEEYAKRLYVAAFDGIATEQRVSAPRYTEGPLGLMQAMNPSEFTVADRTFDYSTLKILSENNERVTVSVDTTVGETKETIRLTLARMQEVFANGEVGGYVYRLDSPTY